MHVASPFPADNPRTDDEVIVPARDGALRVLRHARDEGCARVVMTSSFAAVGYSPSTEQRWTEQDWTDPADNGLDISRVRTPIGVIAMIYESRPNVTADAAAGERFLIVADDPAVTFGELAHMLGVDAAGQTPDHLGRRPQISNAKATSMLGWRPRPVAETIRDTVTSLRDLGLV